MILVPVPYNTYRYCYVFHVTEFTRKKKLVYINFAALYGSWIRMWIHIESRQHSSERLDLDPYMMNVDPKYCFIQFNTLLCTNTFVTTIICIRAASPPQQSRADFTNYKLHAGRMFRLPVFRGGGGNWATS
jgi:hypothetical protein